MAQGESFELRQGFDATAPAIDRLDRTQVGGELVLQLASELKHCVVVFANLRDELTGEIEVVALAIATNQCLTSTPLKEQRVAKPCIVGWQRIGGTGRLIERET
ncbi:MAG: hypothetical protein J2P50_02800 [Hyphomicrobiaceae bacterium]|nr:hypothetical protein [Hyphomicrobiaceae bacterium]